MPTAGRPAAEPSEDVSRRHRMELRRVLWSKLYNIVRGYKPLEVDATLPDGRHWTRALPPSVGAISRVSLCGRTLRETAAAVRLAPAGPDGQRRASFGGAVMCGNVWACPVCAARIMAQRVGELSTLLERHFGHDIGRALPAGQSWRAPADRDASFATLTLPHTWGDTLTRTRGLNRAGWRALLQGRQWVEFKRDFGITGYVARLDVTHGPNGWHPHMHVLFLHSRRLAPRDLTAMRRRIYARWAGWLARQGHARPSYRHGVHLRSGNAGAAEYMQQLRCSLELAGGEGKMGRGDNRAPFQLLADYVARGDERDWLLFRTYVAEMRGARQLTWSRGLKRRFGIGEVGDEELANAPEPEAVTVVEIDAPVWHRLVRVPGALPAVLEAAERGGALAVEQLVFDLVQPEYLREAALLGPPEWAPADWWAPDHPDDMECT